ncbi:Lrp/AsnC family transcriptional regulator [bacterium BFN5]|nr:Lrp/AsnC family transcriptional regulator [bacterium BFN5]
MLDPIDYKIIACLQQNSRMQWKEIGEIVHLTGQAVADRVHRLEDAGVIQGYTISVQLPNANPAVTAFIIVFMKTSSSHAALLRLLDDYKPIIQEAHRISGDGCYWLKVTVPSIEILNTLLNELLKFANYKLSTSIAQLTQK